MAVPDFQSCMLPFLRFLSDRKEHSLRDAEAALAANFELSNAERAELLPSGQQGVFKNRIGWARAYLKKACLIEAPKRGVFRISDRGMKVLGSKPDRIDIKFLEQFPEFIEFRDASRPSSDSSKSENMSEPVPNAPVTPEEAIESASKRSDGKAQLVAQKFRNLLGHCKVNGLAKVFLLRLQHTPQTLQITLLA